jgi:hypothetical protein
VSGPGLQAAFAAWWDARCRDYLDRNFGRAGEEALTQFTELFFPVSADPTFPEQVLALSFIHLRLLGGEPLSIVQQRAERLGPLFGAQGAKPVPGLLYLVLTSSTSTPGKLSSLARVQSAFFSLLLRRIAAALDRGESEASLRDELDGVWDIRGEAAIAAVFAGARGLWRRQADPRLGLGHLEFEPGAWLADNGLGEEMTEALKLFPGVGGHPHLEAIAGRLAAVEVLRGLEGQGMGDAREARERTLSAIQASLAGGMVGITPWEADAFHPVHPLIASLSEWCEKLRLLDEGETPIAYAGRERLADWLKEALEDGRRGGRASGRLIVGGDTYLILGVVAEAPTEALAIEMATPLQEAGEVISLVIRFGGEEVKFRYDLADGRELLAAIRLARQPDIRADLFVRSEEGGWCFGASRYLSPDEAARAEWLRLVLTHLFRKWRGEADLVRRDILKSLKD